MAVRDFDGTGDYMDCEVVDLTGAFTAIWVGKREADGAWHTMFSNQTSADSYRVALSFSNTNRVQGGIQTATAVLLSWNSGQTPTSGTAFTVTASDGYVIVVWAKPAGANMGTLSVYKGGAWTHFGDTVAASGNPGTVGAGKMRVGRFEVADDDMNGRAAALAILPGTALSTVQIETLDGGSASAWEAAFGFNAAGGDILEFAHNAAGSAIASWATLTTSVNGRLDVTATAGNGTIVTGDDPGATIYTLGGAAAATTSLPVRRRRRPPRGLTIR